MFQIISIKIHFSHHVTKNLTIKHFITTFTSVATPAVLMASFNLHHVNVVKILFKTVYCRCLSIF